MDMQVPTSASIAVPNPDAGELCVGLCDAAAMAIDMFFAGSLPEAEAFWDWGSSSFILLENQAVY
jgi:hypothetical protein